MPKSLEELKRLYPALWERARKKYASPSAREQYFRALILTQKARQQEQHRKQQERRRRTRALILFALAALNDLIKRRGVEYTIKYLQSLSNQMKAKEGAAEIDYLPYLLQELQQINVNAEENAGEQDNAYYKRARA